MTARGYRPGYGRGFPGPGPDIAPAPDRRRFYVAREHGPTIAAGLSLDEARALVREHGAGYFFALESGAGPWPDRIPGE